MNRNLKMLGLAVVVVLALSAVAAAAASANVFHSESPSTILRGNQSSGAKNKITISGFPIECTTTDFSGAQTGETAESLTVHPEYQGCTFFGENGKTETEGCNYVFGGTANESGLSPMTVQCEPGKQITMTVFSCKIALKPQEATGGAHFSLGKIGNPSEDEIELAMTVQITKLSGSLCGLLGNTARFTGNDVLKGYWSQNNGILGGQTSIWVE